MKKRGNVFLTIIAFSLVTTMANALELIDYWTFEETTGTTTANEISGRPDATLENFYGTNAGTGFFADTPSTISHSSGSFKFDMNQNTFFQLETRDGYDAIDPGDAFTISMWLKPTWYPYANDMTLFGPRDFTWDNIANLSTLAYVHCQSGDFKINRENSGGEYAGATLPLGAWSQLTMVCENNSVTTYVDGNFVSTIENCNLNYTSTGMPFQFAGKIHAITNSAGDPADLEFGASFSGYLDDIAVWDSALLPWDVEGLANGADPSTYTENGGPDPIPNNYSEVVNVNFVNSAAATAYTGSGAIENTGNAWNTAVAGGVGVTGGVSIDVANAVNDSGAASNISVYLNGFDSTFDYGEAITGELFRNGLTIQSTNMMNEWQIDGLVAGETYDLVIFHEGTGGISFSSGVASELIGSVAAFEGVENAASIAGAGYLAEGYNCSLVSITPTSSTVTGVFCVDSEDLTFATNSWKLAGLQIALQGTVNIPGDANNDGKVDGSDVTILAGNWQKGVNDGQTAIWTEGDFNGDGKVDGSDVTILAGNWQYGVDAAAVSVPEPSTMVGLLSLCLLGLLKFSRKFKKVALMILLGLTITSLAPMAKADLFNYWSIEGSDWEYDLADLVGGNTATLYGMGDEWEADTPAALASSTSSLKLTPTYSSYLSLGDLNISANAAETSSPVEALTLSMWIKPVSLSADTRFFGTNTYTYASEGKTSQLVRINGNTSGFEYIGVNSNLPFVEHEPYTEENQCGWGGWFPTTPNNAIQTNQWSNVIMVWEAGQRMSTYINGELVGYYQGEGIFIDLKGQETTIGQKFFGLYGDGFDGYIDDVAIWGHALSSEGIAAINAGISPLNVEATVSETTPTYAQVVNVDFKFGALPTYQGQGAVSQAGTVWNEPVVSGARNAVGATQTGLVDSQGTATSMGVSVSGFKSGFAAPTDSAYWVEPNAMFDDRLVASADSDNLWSIDGLDIGETYDIYFYGQGKGEISLTDGATADSTSLIYDSGARIFSGDDTPEDWDESITYAVLTVTPTASTISGSILPTGDVEYMSLAGIQICQYAPSAAAAMTVTAVPEPTTWCALVALFFGSLFFRRRQIGR